MIGDEFKSLISLRGRWDVGKRQGHTRDHLHDKRQQRCAAEHVPPPCITRHEVFQARPDQIRNPKPIINPSPRPNNKPFHQMVVIGMAIVLISTWPLTL